MNLSIYHNYLSKSSHPERVSGSILPLIPSVSVARWMLKQVQHDEMWMESTAPFVSSCLRASHSSDLGE